MTYSGLRRGAIGVGEARARYGQPRFGDVITGQGLFTDFFTPFSCCCARRRLLIVQPPTKIPPPSLSYACSLESVRPIYRVTDAFHYSLRLHFLLLPCSLDAMTTPRARLHERYDTPQYAIMPGLLAHDTIITNVALRA